MWRSRSQRVLTELPAQSASVRHDTQIFLVSSQTCLFPHACWLACVHCTQVEPAAVVRQTGLRGLVHPLLLRHVVHVFVEVSQNGWVGLVQSLFCVQPTHLWGLDVVTHTGVGPPHPVPPLKQGVHVFVDVSQTPVGQSAFSRQSTQTLPVNVSISHTAVPGQCAFTLHGTQILLSEQ